MKGTRLFKFNFDVSFRATKTPSKKYQLNIILRLRVSIELCNPFALSSQNLSRLLT